MKTFSHNPEIIFDDVDGVLTLCDTGTSEFFKLNEVGSMIWRVCDEEKKLGEIVDRIREAYPEESPELLWREVDEFVVELAEAGLLVVKEEPRVGAHN
jgi:hypothetical protein